MSRPPSRVGEGLSLAFENEVARLADARDRVRHRLEQSGVDEAAAYAVDLALEELAGNAIRYGYDEGVRGSIRVDVAIEATTIRVTIADDGRPFDPTLHPEPVRARTLAEASVGGRGISLVRRFVRGMGYSRVGDENRIELDVSRSAT